MLKVNQIEPITVQIAPNISAKVQPDEAHDWLMNSTQAAYAYGVSTSALRSCKSNNTLEFVEGKHFLSVQNLDAGNLTSKQTLWTKRGMVRLGFFLRSIRARQIRDWAEDFIVEAMNQAQTPPSVKADSKGQLSLSFGDNNDWYIEKVKKEAYGVAMSVSPRSRVGRFMKMIEPLLFTTKNVEAS